MSFAFATADIGEYVDEVRSRTILTKKHTKHSESGLASLMLSDHHERSEVVRICLMLRKHYHGVTLDDAVQLRMWGQLMRQLEPRHAA